MCVCVRVCWQTMAFKKIFAHFGNYFLQDKIELNGMGTADMRSLFDVELILIASLSNRLQCETCSTYPNAHDGSMCDSIYAMWMCSSYSLELLIEWRSFLRTDVYVWICVHPASNCKWCSKVDIYRWHVQIVFIYFQFSHFEMSKMLFMPASFRRMLWLCDFSFVSCYLDLIKTLSTFLNLIVSVTVSI